MTVRLCARLRARTRAYVCACVRTLLTRPRLKCSIWSYLRVCACVRARVCVRGVCSHVCVFV